MKHRKFNLVASRVAPALLLTTALNVHAQEAPADEPVTTEATVTTEASIGTSATKEAMLSNEFADFLGDNSDTVVDGLRQQGTSFRMETAEAAVEPAVEGEGAGTTADPTVAGAETTDTAATESSSGMGYGNVRITLKLAQAKLGEYGITEPTAEELNAVLGGGTLTAPDGTVVEVEGILAMREAGMGWGQIAHEYDMSVGQLMGNGKGLTMRTQTTETEMAAEGDATGAATGPGKSGARGNGYIPSGKAHGHGITTASGGSAGGMGSGKGKDNGKGVNNAGGSKGGVHTAGGQGHGAGIVSAGGGAGGSAIASNAGGNGRGNGMAKGLNK